MKRNLMLVLAVLLLVLLMPLSAFADETVHNIAAASDRHGDTECVGKAFSGMPQNVEYLSLVGDMVGHEDESKENESGLSLQRGGGNDKPEFKTSTIRDEVRGLGFDLSKNNLEPIEGMSILWASHDENGDDDAGIMFAAGGTGSGVMKTGKNSDGTVAYYIYGIAFNEMKKSDLAEAAAAEFIEWIDTVKDKNIPIIVFCHMPLHYARKDNKGGEAWTEALNYAATGSKSIGEGLQITRDVIYMYGHNHTTETKNGHSGEFYIPSDTRMEVGAAEGNWAQIYFTYVTAGYLSKSTNVAASLISIGENDITITKYKDGEVADDNFYDTESVKSGEFATKFNITPVNKIRRVGAENFSMPDNGIPVVSVTIDESRGTIDAMNSDKDHKTKCYGTVSIDVPEVEGGFHYSDAPDTEIKAIPEQEMEIRGRGNTTWTADKKPYKIKLNEKADIFGLGKNKHWVLIANAYDRTLVKDRMTGWLGDAIGMKFTPRGYPVDLVMKNTDGTFEKYLGSYYLSENVRVDKNRIEIDELGKDDTDPEVITGGYLLQGGEQTDDESPNQIPTKHADWCVDTPSFDPDDGGYVNDAQKDYIKGYIQDVEDALFSGDFDAEGGGEYRSMMDIRSAALYWLVDQASMNGDGYRTGSTYIYKTRDKTKDGVTTKGMFYWGPLWDFDFAWGYNDDEMAFNIWHDWVNAMMSDRSEGGFVEEVKNNWPAVKAKLEELYRDGGVIDGYYEETKASQAADVIVNPEKDTDENGKTYVVRYNYKDEIEKLKAWMKTRTEWIDEHIDDIDNLSHKVVYAYDDKVLLVDYINDGGWIGESECYPDIDGQVFVGWMDESGELIDPDELHVTRDMTLTAKYIPEEEATHAKDILLRNKIIAMTLTGDGAASHVAYTLIPEDAQYKKVEWSSSDENVVTVDTDGNLKAVGTGSAVITASLKYGETRTMEVVVADGEIPGPEKVWADKESFSLVPGEYVQIQLGTDPTPARIDYYEYTSGNDDVLTVNENGAVRAVGPGKAKIKVEVLNFDEEYNITWYRKLTITVNVKDTRKTNPIKVSKKNKTVKYTKLKKKAVTLKAITVKKAAGKVTYKKVSVSKKKFAGRFTVNKKTGKIKVKKGTKKGTYKVKVRVSAAGNKTYKPASKTVTVKIKVK